MATQLYHVTLQRPSAITASVAGQFSGQKAQEIAVARGQWLELLRPDARGDRLVTLLRHNTFSILRSLAAFRLAGASKDYLVVSSDSGRIAVLEYQADKNQLKQVHLETYGKTGVRRVVPGQYLAVDPKGRATMVASVERNKLVYVLNRDADTNLTISSPLEAHTSRALVYALVGVDNGYENPIFAAIEAEYKPTGAPAAGISKRLIYYELDLGLNHVVRRWVEPVDATANVLLQVPGGPDGPSGVLVGADEYVYYKHFNAREPLRVAIPRRKHAESTYIVAAAMHKMRGMFFFLVQSNHGDLYRVSLDLAEDDPSVVTGMRIKFFGTAPVATTINILKSGFMFVACEGGDHRLYQFQSLGDDDDEPEYSHESHETQATFEPRDLGNFVETCLVPSLNPLMRGAVAGLGGEVPQLVAACGQGPQAALKVIDHGIKVSEVVSSPMPAVPSGVWTVRTRESDDVDKYILLSFASSTLVLEVGESVTEVRDSPFNGRVATLAVEQLGRDAFLQVHPGGLRHITASGEVNEWEAPAGAYIKCAATNRFQVAIALSTDELVYFEVDDDGQLNEYYERKPVPGGPVCLSIGDVPEGRLRSPYLAVGCANSTVRVLSLDYENTLETLSVQGLTAEPSDILIMTMDANMLYLHIGLTSGVYIISHLDNLSGELSDTKTRFLGPRAVRLFPANNMYQEAGDPPCVLGLSTRSWLGYTRGLQFEMAPLLYESLTHAARFTTAAIPNGMVAVEGQNLRIFAIEETGEHIHQDAVPLRNTPRGIVQNSFSPLFYVAEADNNRSDGGTEVKVEDGVKAEESGPPPHEDEAYQEQARSWMSTIQVVDPVARSVVQTIKLRDNEAAFSVVSCRFAAHDREYLVVGTAKDLVVMPKRSNGGFIRVYEYSEDGRELSFVHKTAVDEVPVAMAEFDGRLLAACGRRLRIYELGLKQVLRKAETTLDLNNIVSLEVHGHRVVAADIQRSLNYLVYKPSVNQFLLFADDAVARHITCTHMLDYETVAAGDKFGNVFLLRNTRRASRMSEEDDQGVLLKIQDPVLNSAPNKLSLVAHYYVEDVPTSLNLASLAVGGTSALIYTGIQGTIGAFIPFVSKNDAEFFQQLESLLRREDFPTLTGRDHLVFRSYYAPNKGVIDGDLCERFAILPTDKQLSIAAELDRTPREVEKKIADLRLRSVF